MLSPSLLPEEENEEIEPTVKRYAMVNIFVDWEAVYIACVSGGIVGAREIKFWRRSREENGEGDFEISRGF